MLEEPTPISDAPISAWQRTSMRPSPASHEETKRSHSAGSVAAREEHAVDSDATPPAACSRLRLGTRFGADLRYELSTPIARGGTSMVHRVQDHVLERELAGKFLIDASDDALKAVIAEARVMARLRHPNLVTVFDAGSCEGVPYLLMERLHGCTLDVVLARERLSPYQAFSEIGAVCAGLKHAHANGVLHLDIKPGNVHVGDDGVARLLDFGVGSELWGARPSSSESIVGTPGYMAPEQWCGGRTDERTDVWALGVLLQELLSGRPPDRTTIAGTEPTLPPRLGQFEGADQVILRALERDPAQRFQSVAQFEAAVRVVFGTLLAASIDELSLPVVHVGACLRMVEAEFEIHEVQRLSGLRREVVEASLGRLARIGVIVRHPQRPAYFRLLQSEVAAACCARLSAQRLRACLPRLLAQR